MLEAPEAFGRKSLAEKGSRLVALVRVCSLQLICNASIWSPTKWTFLIAYSEMLTVQVLVLTVSIVGIVVQTMRGFNFYGPDQKACSREVSTNMLQPLSCIPALLSLVANLSLQN